MTSTPLDIPFGRAAGERRLYTAAAIAGLAIVFAGFAPTYYLKGVFGTPELTALKHIHGIVMTAWFALFLVQARLIATGRVLEHRKLGILGVLLAVLVVSVGMTIAIASARSGAPFSLFAGTDLVILACIAFDTMRNRRVHPAFVVGLVFIVAGQIGRLLLSRTPEWMMFAKWLVG